MLGIYDVLACAIFHGNALHSYFLHCRSHSIYTEPCNEPIRDRPSRSHINTLDCHVWC